MTGTDGFNAIEYLFGQVNGAGLGLIPSFLDNETTIVSLGSLTGLITTSSGGTFSTGAPSEVGSSLVSAGGVGEGHSEVTCLKTIEDVGRL